MAKHQKRFTITTAVPKQHRPQLVFALRAQASKGTHQSKRAYQRTAKHKGRPTDFSRDGLFACPVA